MFQNTIFDTIKIASAQEQGKRTYMEDEIILENKSFYYVSGVFDGHGGKRASKFLRNNFVNYLEEELKLTNYNIPSSLFNTIKVINEVVIKKSKTGWTSSGSTVNVIVIDKISQQLYVLNVGDSRAIVCNLDNSGYSTKDHKASDPIEKANIEKRGGFVNYENRVNGTLLLSRAIGDVDVHKFISCQPDIFVLPIETNINFILQASDGLFDVMSNYELCNKINRYLNAGWTNQKIVDELMREALHVKNTQDNVSIILITFR